MVFFIKKLISLIVQRRSKRGSMVIQFSKIRHKNFVLKCPSGGIRTHDTLGDSGQKP